MSALLEGLADESGRIPFSLSGDDSIDHVQNGIPFDSNGSVAASLNGIIDHYHQGLPFDADGRLVITTDDVVRYGSGAAPFDADNALCAAGTPPVVRWANGVPYTDNGKIAGSDVSVFEFVFNGTDQYATMLGWAALGKPRRYKFSFTANAVATGTEQYILSGTEGGVDLNFYLHATLPVLSIQYRNEAGGQAIEGVLDSADEIVAGTNYDVEVINLGTGPEILINGNPVDLTAFAASDGLQPPLTHIGAKHDVTGFFGGVIKTALLADDSPIQDTYANMGDGARYGELEQTIELAGDFEISFDWIRQDVSGTSLSVSVGSPTSLARIEMGDTGGTFANNVRAISDTGATRASGPILDNIAIGQHCNIKVISTAAGVSFSVDGGTPVVDAAISGPLTLGRIGARNNAIRYPANAALQNIVIKDLTNNYTFNYPLNEGPTTDTGPELISGAPTLIGGSATWDGSTLHLEGTNSSGTFEGAGVVSGGDYHVTFDYNTSAANTYIRLGGGGNLALIPGPAIGTFDEVLSAGGTGYVLNIASDNNSGDFTNFSVKSATGGDIIHNIDPSTPGYNGSWTPDTAWTFIDSNTRYYPMNEGSGDTFHEAYSNPMPTYRSSNLVSNGKFTTSDDWVISGGWTIDTVSGVAMFSGATDESMIQTFTTTPGTTYQIDFDIEIMVNLPVMAASGFATPVSGPVQVAPGNNEVILVNETINRKISRTIHAETVSTDFGFAGNGGTEFTIGNVEVREIVPGSLDATIINYTDNWLESVP